jgi:hypothetical protein
MPSGLVNKPKGQSRKDNPETLATLSTQDTRHKTKKKKTTKKDNTEN